MDPNSRTSVSMLQGLRDQDPEQWDRFVQLYGPLVYEWCRRRGIGEHDAADIVQEVFRAVSNRIATFRKERPHDTFGGWLRKITHFKVADHFRRQAKRVVARGGSTANLRLKTIAFDVSETADETELALDKHSLYMRALELLESSFEPRTWQAFWSVAVEDQPAQSVAETLKMTPGAVHNAKYKVLKRLRTEFEDLL